MGSADGGQVNVSVAGLLLLDGGSFIASDTFGTGNAGGVFIVAGVVDADGGQLHHLQCVRATAMAASST